jgi:hypothetical protein
MIRRNTPTHVRLEILTDTLADAWSRYRECPTEHARRTVSSIAQARMRVQLPPAGPPPQDPVELEVAAMFPETDAHDGPGGWQ